jgi:hypothetical protein
MLASAPRLWERSVSIDPSPEESVRPKREAKWRGELPRLENEEKEKRLSKFSRQINQNKNWNLSVNKRSFLDY